MFNSKVIYYAPESGTAAKTHFRTPAVDIVESDNAFKLHISLPGVKKEDLSIHIHEQVLTVKGTVNRALQENEKYVLHEIRYHGFERKFRLSDAIDIEKIDAKLADGLLTLTLEKKPETQPRSININ